MGHQNTRTIKKRSTWPAVFNRPESMTFALLLLALIGASLLSEFFLDFNYILRSFTLTAELSIAALVLTMVIISGEIDLSAAANIALSACIFAYVQASGFPMTVAILAGLFAGFLMGSLNAILVIVYQLPSIIVTIGTLIFYRGLAQVIAGDKSIRVPEWFIGINTKMLFGIPKIHNFEDFGVPWGFHAGNWDRGQSFSWGQEV